MPEQGAYDGVAIVDDEAQLVRTYELIFQRRQIPVAFTAGDGEDALDRFRDASPRPGVVIVDYRLPSMSGLELMKSLLQIDRGVKIVIISADDSVRTEALKNGAAAFMKKPVSIQEIVGTIKSLMAA